MKTNVLLWINSKRRKLDHHPLHLSFLHLMKRRKWYMAAQQDNKGEIQRQSFSVEMAKATSTRRTQPIYKWRRQSQTVTNSNAWSLKNQSTSRNFRSTKEAWYQQLLLLDLSHYSARIWRALVSNFKKPDQPACQLSASNATSTSIQKICIDDLDPPLPTSIKTSLKHRGILHQLCFPASFSQTPTSRRTGSICSDKKSDHTKWW